MIQMQPLSEAADAREALKHISDGNNVLRRAAEVLELVAHSSVGLGEVLQDYAHQTCGQLREIIRAAENVGKGMAQKGDAEALANIHSVFKAVKSVLEMTPPAMLRNRADALGEKEKLTRAEVGKITYAFLHSPDIAALLAAEDSGALFAGLATAAGANMDEFAPERQQSLVAAGH